MTMIITYPSANKSIMFTKIPQAVINKAMTFMSNNPDFGRQGCGLIIKVVDDKEEPREKVSSV